MWLYVLTYTYTKVDLHHLCVCMMWCFWCGCVQVRNMQREVSRDADIVVAAMISIVGSTLIFQGWRLDPLLLLCQVGPECCLIT